LKVKYLSELNVCSSSHPKDTYLGRLSFVEPDCKKKPNPECENMYIMAKGLFADTLNLSNGFVIAKGLRQETEWTFSKFTKRLSYLLKRTLNDIKYNCQLNKDSAQAIAFYDQINPSRNTELDTIDFGDDWYSSLN
jgi:hypothetical protein